jgi:hypothetical protein
MDCSLFMEEAAMKTIKMSAVMAGMLGAGALLMAVPVVSSAAAGEGWDSFNSGDGQSIAASSAYLGTALVSSPSDGFDVLNLDVEIHSSSGAAYYGTSMEAAPSGDSDAFKSGAV